MSVLAAPGMIVGMVVILALRVTRDVVWVEVVGGSADGVVDYVLFGLLGISH